MKKVLFTGATGLLGKYFFLNPPSEYELFGTFNKNLNLKENNFFPLNISDKNEVFDLIQKIKPNYVVHAAAIGNVDYCETHKKEAKDVNVNGTKNVAEASKKVNAVMLFTSSNAIYDGENPPYSETSNPNPLDYYGKTKELGEMVVKESGASYSILRLMTMFGWPSAGGRNNPVGWVIEELGKRNKINVVDDIYNNHLYAGQATEAIWEIIKRKKVNETYNVAGGESVSRYELTIKTAEVFGLDESLINPVDSDFFKNIVPRPKNTTFATKKIEKDLGIKPFKIVEGLKKMKDEK